jgi:hypothetical protein
MTCSIRLQLVFVIFCITNYMIFGLASSANLIISDFDDDEELISLYDENDSVIELVDQNITANIYDPNKAQWAKT